VHVDRAPFTSLPASHSLHVLPSSLYLFNPRSAQAVHVLAP
jgi:hypothetical protein